MNAVEIEEAVSKLVEAAFDASEFPFAFLEAFGNRATTIKRLRTGNSNASEIEGGVLQRNNIHLAVCDSGTVSETLARLKVSPATAKARAKFILATDGIELEAEDLISGETVACDYIDLADNFGFFLPLAGITTVKEIRENAIDIKATGRLNRLYIELLRNNESWGKEERRHEMNVFMARLIFCFFAEDTDIFYGDNLFTSTIKKMSDNQSKNTNQIIGQIFRAMDTKKEKRQFAGVPRWADAFPYVNGGLFAGASDVDVPNFSRIARSYLTHAGELSWKEINPDIFGSMIQAVTDDEERDAIGLHYTSVPNILKVLNPLFLNDLRARLSEIGNNQRKLFNLRQRISRIRVFDPACGSGNFLVIAYKEMRLIESQINKRRGEIGRRTDIPLTNFRGIELRDFPAEIARLALIIAEYQCDVLYRGQLEALNGFLPLDAMNWIVCGNALRLDWLGVCPHTGTDAQINSDELLEKPFNQSQIEFENEGGETYVCGNPPYRGSTWQTAEQKEDLRRVFDGVARKWKLLDYVAGWFMKAADYGKRTGSTAAFVSTNSICQGTQVPILWSALFDTGHEINFAHTSFKWSNLASHNAGVTVVIVGISRRSTVRKLYVGNSVREVNDINPFLIAAPTMFVEPIHEVPNGRSSMLIGNKPVDGGNLLLSNNELAALELTAQQQTCVARRMCGSAEFIKGQIRHCLWIEDRYLDQVRTVPAIVKRIEKVREMRAKSRKMPTREASKQPHRFAEIRGTSAKWSIIVPSVSSENRPWLPVGLLDNSTVISNAAFAVYDAPLWNMALIASRMHLVWVAAVCGRLGTGYRYSNTLGWNTFFVPVLTEKNQTDLTRCAVDILLAREAHFPATIAELYDPDKIPKNLCTAHDTNDETLERIYIGRRFRNDTERLEKLFELYAKTLGQRRAQANDRQVVGNQP